MHDIFVVWIERTRQFAGQSSLRPVYSDTTQLNSTDLLRADWLYAVQLGQLHCRSSATVTQLNSTRRRVELGCDAIINIKMYHW